MDPMKFFQIAEFLASLKNNLNFTEISYRTVINRLYYGIFHLVQKKLNIFIPETEIKRCHAYVKNHIDNSKIRSDYSDLEAFRVEVDYNLLKPIKQTHMKDALRLKNRILNKISDPDYDPYDTDDEYFFYKSKS